MKFLCTIAGLGPDTDYAVRKSVVTVESTISNKSYTILVRDRPLGSAEIAYTKWKDKQCPRQLFCLGPDTGFPARHNGGKCRKEKR